MESRSEFGEPLEKVIDVAVRVARAHDSGVMIEDLLLLLPNGTTTQDVETALKDLPSMQNRYQLRDGLVIPRSRAADDFKSRLDTSLLNLGVAKRFSELLNQRGILAIAVSGSTSYKMASRRDDVDLFCVTNTNGLWGFLARALLLTRVFRMAGRSTPPICISCVMDADFAGRTFAEDQGALFARDALVAEPVKGGEFYTELLQSGPWMRRFFPRLYDLKSDVAGARHTSIPSPTTSRITNLFLFAVLGTYVRAKAIYHNLRLAKLGLRRYAFKAKVGPDHLIYESAKYLDLRRTYGEIEAKEGISDDTRPADPAKSAG